MQDRIDLDPWLAEQPTARYIMQVGAVSLTRTALHTMQLGL